MTESAPASWWDQFLAALISPTAAADVVLTLLSVGLAFLGAFWLFRGQLSHDRQLTQVQLAAERTERVNDARRQAARKLGNALITAQDEFNSMDGPTLFEAVSRPGFNGDQGAPGAETIYRAFRVAEHELDLDDIILRLRRVRLAWWHGVRSVHDSGRLKRLPREQQAHVLFALADEYFTPNGEQLLELGRALMRWDGAGEVPTLDQVFMKGCETPAALAQSVERLLTRELPKLPW